VSTCNRTEIYCATSDAAQIGQWLAAINQVDPAKLEPHLYTLPRDKAVAHAFRVASGLESMVLGEPQILGQIKEAYRITYRSGLPPAKALGEMDACKDWAAAAGRFREFVRQVVTAQPPYDRGLCPARPRVGADE